MPELLRNPIWQFVGAVLARAAEEGRLEGAPTPVLTNHYERSAQNRAAVAHHGTTCQVCGFNFGTVYGPHGAGFSEVHHLRPLASYAGPVVIDPATDLAVLCANCHRMIHRTAGHPLTLDELRALVNGARGA